MYLTDADAEGERLPALVAGVEHRAVLQPPRVVRLDELALLGGGAGAHEAVAEAEPGGGPPRAGTPQKRPPPPPGAGWPRTALRSRPRAGGGRESRGSWWWCRKAGVSQCWGWEG
jgi:hypothetical protein